MADHCKPQWFIGPLWNDAHSATCTELLIRIGAVDMKKCPKQFYNDSTNIYTCNENLSQ